MTNESTTPQRGLTRQQVIRLMGAIDASHVDKKQGLSYIAQHQARAEMTRIFGVGNWDSDTESMELMYETVLNEGDPQYPTKANGKPYYVTCYRAAVRVRIRDYWGNQIATFREFHAEENAPLPNRGEAHAMAITSSESYALRRALIGLGDRLGLGLYENGSVAPLVVGTLQLTDPESPLYAEPRTAQQAGPAASSTHQDKFNRAATTPGPAPEAPPTA